MNALAITPNDPNDAKTAQTQRLDHITSLKGLKEEILDTHEYLRDRYIVLPNVTNEGQYSIFRVGLAGKYAEMPWVGGYTDGVPLRDRCNFGRSSWLISQALSVTYVPGEHRLYLERSCRPPENPATADSGMARGLPVPKGLNSRQQFGPAVERRRKSRPRSTGFHGSSPCKCQRLSTLRSSWLPPSRPPTKSGAAQAAVD